MPLFKIVPSCPDAQAMEVEAGNATAALYLVSSRGLTGADVWSEGLYIFSAKTQGSPNAFWAIYQREELKTASISVLSTGLER